MPLIPSDRTAEVEHRTKTARAGPPMLSSRRSAPARRTQGPNGADPTVLATTTLLKQTESAQTVKRPLALKRPRAGAGHHTRRAEPIDGNPPLSQARSARHDRLTKDIAPSQPVAPIPYRQASRLRRS